MLGRRTAAYIRSTSDHAVAEPNAAAHFAHKNNMTLGAYFFDRPGELGALSRIAQRRSEFDVLLIDPSERDALEFNEGFRLAVSGVEVVWMTDHAKAW